MRENLGQGLMRAVATQIVHGLLRDDETQHFAELIEVPAHLEGVADYCDNPKLRARAIELGRQWHEWLLFPCDPMPDGVGFDARFLLNKFLDVHVWARVAHQHSQ